MFNRKIQDIPDWQLKIYSAFWVLFCLPTHLENAWIQHYNVYLKMQLEALRDDINKSHK